MRVANFDNTMLLVLCWAKLHLYDISLVEKITFSRIQASGFKLSSNMIGFYLFLVIFGRAVDIFTSGFIALTNVIKNMSSIGQKRFINIFQNH